MEKSHGPMTRMSASYGSLVALSSNSLDGDNYDRNEADALRRELEVSKKRREDDLEMYLKMAADIKQTAIDAAANANVDANG